MTPRSLRFGVQGMTCAACSARVERRLRKLPGVDSVSVNLATEKAALRYDGDLIQIGLILDAVSQAGYQPVVATASVSLEAAAQERIRGLEGVLTLDGSSLKYLPEILPAGRLKNAVHEAGGQYHEERSQQEDAEATLRRDFLIAAALSLPLMLSMLWQHMPNLWQWILTTPVLLGPGRRFYRLGWKAFRQASPDMNSLVMLGSGAAYLYSSWITFRGSHHDHVYFEAASVVIAMVLLGKLLETRAKGQARQALERLLGLQARTAILLEGEQQREIPVDDVIPGDRLRILPGQSIPVDGVVESGNSAIDESMLTGESIPVARGPGEALVGGTLNGNGSLVMRTTAVGADTVLAHIVAMVEAAQSQKPPIQALVDRVVAHFVPAVLLIALATLGLWSWLGTFEQALVHSVTVLVIACPCAMGLATPTSLLVGTGRAAEFGILFRSGAALQRLQETHLVAFDKTGTVTEGKPRVTNIQWLDPSRSQNDILRLGAAVEQLSEHPLARAVVDAARERDLALPPAEAFQAVPGQGALATVEGLSVRVGSPRFLAHSADPIPQGAVFIEIGGTLAAALSFSDPVKASARGVVEGLQKMGKEVALISGDRQENVRPVAEALGIQRFLAQILPEGKAAAIQELQKSGPVAFVGDGMNDAPALAQADVGIALRSGTDLAVESADVVLVTSELSAILRAVTLSLKTMANIRQNLFWAFAYNVALIPVAAGLTGWSLSPSLAGAAMACSSFLVVSNALRLRRA